MSLAALSVGFVAGFLTGNSTSKEVAKPIQKKTGTIRVKRTRSPHKRRLWTESEERALTSLVSKKYGNAEIARLMGRPKTSISSKKKSLKI